MIDESKKKFFLNPPNKWRHAEPSVFVTVIGCNSPLCKFDFVNLSALSAPPLSGAFSCQRVHADDQGARRNPTKYNWFILGWLCWPIGGEKNITKEAILFDNNDILYHNILCYSLKHLTIYDDCWAFLTLFGGNMKQNWIKWEMLPAVLLLLQFIKSSNVHRSKVDLFKISIFFFCTNANKNVSGIRNNVSGRNWFEKKNISTGI